jgi:ribosomal protein S18 acetylase RimI-like enzyme
MRICIATDDQDLLQILELQKENLKFNISEEVALQNGFLIIAHTLDVLKSMNKEAPQIIALDQKKLAGFALVMLKDFKDLVPALKPMFDLFNSLEFKGKPVESYNYYVMGQICVKEEYRGKGIFDQLYNKHKELYSEKFDFCLTEVAVRNKRSMKAHNRVGFKTIATYRDDQEEWNIMVWDWHQ